MNKILICDDEKDIVSAIKIYLEAEGFETVSAYNGKEALEIVKRETCDLILLDIMMPVCDGITALVAIREICNVPIILLTAKSEDTDKILGLNVGADDYITKPFNPVEMIARVKAQLRRYTKLGSSAQSGILRVGDIELDDTKKSVTANGEEVSLTRTEYDILKLLMSEPGKVFSPKAIYKAIKNEVPFGAEGAISVHIRHIREKTEIDPANPSHLKVVWGQGYKIEGGKEITWKS